MQFSVTPVKTEEDFQDLRPWQERFGKNILLQLLENNRFLICWSSFSPCSALKKAIYEDGYHYWFLCSNNEASWLYRRSSRWRIAFLESKLYLKKECPWTRLARKAFSFLCGLCKEAGMRNNLAYLQPG